MKKQHKAPSPSANEALAEISALGEEISAEPDPRVRRKLGRRLAYLGSCLADSEDDITIADMEAGIAALKLARKTTATLDAMNRSQARLTKRRLDAMGCAEAEVLGEVKKTVGVDSGCLAATAHPALDPTFLLGSNDDIVAAMNQGKFFLTAIGADGRFRIALRLVDAPEPVLQAKEYARLEASSEVGYLRITTGALYFGAPEHLAKAAVLELPNGLVKVQTFCLVNRGRVLTVLVACATDTPPPPLAGMQEIG